MNTRIFKIILGIILGIVFLIVDFYAIGLISLDNVEKNITTVSGKREPLNKNNKQIYVKYMEEEHGWLVVGRDGVLFDQENGEENEIIYALGSVPNKMNPDLLENNIFVLEGDYFGGKTYKNVLHGCFYVESFGVLGKLQRTVDTYLSNSSITLRDYIVAKEIPAIEFNELKDTD